MQRLIPTPPEGAEVLQAGGRGGTGNMLYLFAQEQPPLVLKVYRTRRSRLREFLKDFSERFLEGKRGATAAIRCATERLTLDLWTREGFDVTRHAERPLPSGVTMPALWIEFCDAPLLSEVLADRTRAVAMRRSLVERLGQSLSRRHSRAVELNEPLLVHEHGQIKHFFVQGNRLVAFDLEHGFKPGYPVLRAVARELAGIAVSLARADKAATGQFLHALAAGYTNKTLLKQAISQVNRGGGLSGKIRRWRERNSHSTCNKARVVERFGELVETGAGAAVNDGDLSGL